MEYPHMVYKAGVASGADGDWLIVDDKAAEDAATKDGFTRHGASVAKPVKRKKDEPSK